MIALITSFFWSSFVFILLVGFYWQYIRCRHVLLSACQNLVTQAQRIYVLLVHRYDTPIVCSIGADNLALPPLTLNLCTIVAISEPEASLRSRTEHEPPTNANDEGSALNRGIEDVYTADSLFRIQRDGHALAANLSLAQLLGDSTPEATVERMNRLGEQLYVDPGDYQNFTRLLAQQRGVFAFETQLYHADGSIIWTTQKGRAVYDEDGELLYYDVFVSDCTDLKAIESLLIYHSFHDEMTGLPNRELFMLRLGQAVERLKKAPNTFFAIFFLDCDNFKTVNNSLGHMTGDLVLAAVAHRLKNCIHPNDTLARFGGDEFALLLEQHQDVEDAIRVAQTIAQHFRLPVVVEGREVFLSLSMGITTSDMGYTQAEDVLRDTDTALYHAKALGRGQYSLFDTLMHQRAVRRLEISTELQRTLEKNELRVYYQPIMSLATGGIAGFEALVRWQHPQRGLIAPGEFLYLADEIGMGIEIDRWVLETACHQMYEWQQRFGSVTPLMISVNMSSRQLAQPDLVDYVKRVLHETGLPPTSLKLEITEDVVIEQTETTVLTLKHLQALGVQISLDDFGTGYSSLSYLHRLPINTLKIDRSFVSGVDVDQRILDVVRAIVTLAHSLGMDVIAEGAETVRHLDHLRLLQCEYSQGFFFSPPVDAQHATRLLETQPHMVATDHATEPAPSAPVEIQGIDDASPAARINPADLQQAVEILHHVVTTGIPVVSPPEQHDLGQRDPLTHLLTRTTMDLWLHRLTHANSQKSEPFALIVLDLDHFKSINDAFGHSRGDQVLVEFAHRARATTRASDFIFRYGGDEFVILLKDTDKEQAIAFTQRLLHNVQTVPFAGEPVLSLTLSMGVAFFPSDGQTPDALFDIADQRNGLAKRHGRAQAVWEDLARVDTASIEGPSRLIERDQALEQLQHFFEALPHSQRGIIQLVGEPGSGITRFFAQIEQAAELQRYCVLTLHGTAALKGRVYGVLTEALQEWPELSLPGHDVASFELALQQLLQAQQVQGLWVLLDQIADIDSTTLTALRSLFHCSEIPCLVLVYATNSTIPHPAMPQEAALRVQITLEPLSPNGLRTWLRHSLNWEVPEKLLQWFYDQTGGQPGSIRRGLRYLLDHDVLTSGGNGWSYAPHITTLSLSGYLKTETERSPYSFPSDLTEFIGREDDIRRLKMLIQEQRLVVVLAPGGMGKTRLALQTAAECTARFADGVCFVPLHTLGSPDFVIYALAEALQLSLAGPQSPREQVLHYVRSRTMLLVFDSFEHFREDVTLLQDILEQAPGVHLLITSRDRMNIPGMVSFELGGLNVPESETDTSIERYSAVQLFIRSARQTYAEFTYTAADVPFIARICRLLEGMPLGIELAAAWVRTFSCQTIAEKIELNLSFLVTDRPEVHGRHRSLLAMIDSFWFLLSEAEQSIVRQISVFRGGFSGEAARQVLGASPFFLEGLVAKGYLRWTSQKRYEIHELLRQYAADKLAVFPEEQAQAAEQHATYYLALLQQREMLAFGSRQTLHSITVDLENVRSAWSWAVRQHCTIEIGRSIDGLSAFYELRGLFHEAETTFCQAAVQLHAHAFIPLSPLTPGPSSHQGDDGE
ncbi:MAG: diguanylate cyclase, partial [Chloroflexaceae bacterium]|nr:diguanylate cyclase [Chloroflexaceae bacterium]